MPRAVILTALSVEYLAVRAHLSDLREEVHPQGTVYERGQFVAEGESWEVGIIEVGQGNPGAAVEAERAIGYFNPDVIFFVGVAGGIKDVTIGDVVVATEVYSYEFGKAGETFQTRPKSRDADYGLEQRARAEARKGDWLQRLAKVPDPVPKVFVGPIAAGEKVIASLQSEVFQLLRSHYEDAIAVEMEGFGFLSAVRGHKQVDAIVIRGISDLIDGKAKADREGSQELAACHASAFAFQMLSKLVQESASGEGELSNGATIAQNNNDKTKSTGKPDVPPRSSIPMVLPKSAQEINLDSVSPQVFISYSHDSQEHKDRVLELANRLRADGIDCTIDQYEESPAEGWQRWMLNQVEEATFVLVACTEQYDRRFRGREAAGKGKGATWEGGVIIQELYDDQGQNAKFIPVTLASEDANFIPSPLRGATSYRLNTTDGYELLYRRLTNQPRTRKPELGKLQTLAPRDRLQFFLNEDRQGSLKEELLSASKGLLDWKRTLGNDEQITRPELVQLTDRIETEASSITIVLGSPGCGKSALMATLGHWAVDENHVLLAIKADYLSNAVNTLEDLQQDIHLSWHIHDAIRAIASTNKVILLIDQLDAVAEMLDRQPGRLNVLLSLIQSLAGTKNVHIVATCREFEFRHGTQFARLESFERMDLHLPAWEDIAPFLEKEQHNPNAMGEPLRELLQNPLHLKIFLEIAKPGDVFESLPRLLDQLWQLSIVEKPQPKESIAFLTELADQMTEEEVLWLPSAIADEKPEICRALEQAGILMTNPENSTLGFCHQTFYDHTLARSFARRSSNLLVELVLERQDGIFVRPILLRSLNYLRGTASSRYQQQLKTLLTSFDQPIRTHIRTLLLEFVGAQTKPNATEASLLIPLLNSETEGIKVLDAMVGSPGWFRKLRDCTEFRQWLEKPVEQAVYCCPLLTTAVDFAAESVWGLLEEYWLNDQTYDSLSIRVIWSSSQWTSERVYLVQQIIQRSNIGWDYVLAIAERIAKSLPNDAARVICAHLQFRATQALEASKVPPPELPVDADEFKRSIHSYQHDPLNSLKAILESQSDFAEIGQFAEKHPQSFLTSIWPCFTDLIQPLVYDSNSIVTSYCQDKLGGFQFSRSEIIQSLITAIVELAKLDGEVFLRFFEENKDSDLIIIHRLLTYGLEIIATEKPTYILSYLLADPRRFDLGGQMGSTRHSETAKLITAIYPNLKLEDKTRLGQAIKDFTHWRPKGDEDIDFRRRCLIYNREHRLSLLKAIPEVSLIPETKRLKQEEERALPWFSLRKSDGVVIAQDVGPRMTKDEMSRASDEHLLNLFNELSDETEWNHPRHQWSDDRSRAGGAIQQSREFGELVKDDPSRFTRILPQLEPQRHESYVSKALQDLAEANFPADSLINIIEALDHRGFVSEEFRSDVASALEKIAERNRGLPASTLTLLESWLPTHTKPQMEHYQSKEEHSSALKSPILFNVGGSHVLPDGRGSIARALADGYLKQDPPDRKQWKRFIQSQLGVESHPVVWVDILTSMPSLLSGDSAEATELFDRVIRNCPEVLQYPWALYFIARAIGWFEPQEMVQGWLEMLQAGNSNFSQQAYGELLLIQYLQYQDEWSVERIRNHLAMQDNEAILCGLAHVASHLWIQQRCRDIATEILYTLAASSVQSVQHAVANVFRWSRDDFELNPGMVKLIQAVCKNQGVLLEAATDLTEIIEAEELVDNNPEIAVTVCQSLVNLGSELTNPKRATGLIAESLTTLAIKLHRQDDYREVGLEIFESLLILNLRETRSALEALDRKPNRPGSYLAPRRRIRGRRTRR